MLFLFLNFTFPPNLFLLGESKGKTMNERTLDHAITVFEIFFIQHV